MDVWPFLLYDTVEWPSCVLMTCKRLPGAELSAVYPKDSQSMLADTLVRGLRGVRDTGGFHFARDRDRAPLHNAPAPSLTPTHPDTIA